MLSESLRQSLATATVRYNAAVDQAADYLGQRGITKDVADKHLLGFVTPENVDVGHDSYVNRLVIPYLTPTGVVDVRFRSISDDAGPKYLGRPGAELQMYNVMAFQDPSDVIAICEGELDTIVAGMCGIPAVGLAGVNAWKPFYTRAFLDYQRVIVLADGDQPGREMGKRIAQQIDHAIVVSMPDGMDVNSTFLAEGADAVRRRIGVA